MMEKGLVQVYMGDGKGKTTAAFGLALRACGQGLRVFICQFVKGQESGEATAAARLASCLSVRRFGRGSFIRGRPEAEDIALARQGWEESRRAVLSGGWDVVVLDEIGIALYFGLIPLPEVLALLDGRPVGTELVLTGRTIHEEVLARADLITEMRAVRHPFDRGVAARRGIEY